MNFVEVLVNVGTPSAAVSLLVVAWWFWNRSHRISQVALVAAIVFIVAFGVATLWQRSLAPIRLATTPERWFAVGPDGAPAPVRIAALRGADTISDTTVAARAEQWTSLQLVRDSGDPSMYRVLSSDVSLGFVSEQALLDAGWYRVVGGSGSTPLFTTNKVRIGRLEQWDCGGRRFHLTPLGYPPAGNEFSARLRIELRRGAQTYTDTISVINKRFAETILGEDVFYVALREAGYLNDDPEDPWGAFTVFPSPGSPIARGC